MFTRISIKEFENGYKNTSVLGADIFGVVPVFGKKGKRIEKEDKYKFKVLEALCKGMFCGLITDLEYGRVKNLIGDKTFYKFLDSKIEANSKARLFQIKVAGYLKEYKEMPAYRCLFKLIEDGNMHVPNLTTIIAAIELDLPIVSSDLHFYTQRNNICDAYRERRIEERKQAITEKRKTKDIAICDPQYFCKDVLKI